MRAFRVCVVIVGAALLMATSAEAAAIQWTTGLGANFHWYWWSFGAQSFDPHLADNVPLDPDGPGGNAPLTGYTSYLGTITSAEEQIFINNHPDNPRVAYWIAASDAAVEGVWRWVAGPEIGQLVPLTGPGQNWCQGEPNDFPPSGGEDAAVSNWCSNGPWGNGGWNDLNVTSQNRYLIEWSPTAVPEPGTLVLLSTGIAAVIRSRRRR
jgi:hypothetical protein